jgi:transcriptional regulator of acetoin/glycerol metabolism
MIGDGRFRPDLYYRISAFPIDLPPVRARHGDIGLIAESILRRIADARPGARPCVLHEAARACLDAYPWPGNIRELRNVLERACLFADDGVIRVEHLPDALRAAHGGALPSPGSAAPDDDNLRRVAGSFHGTRKALAARLGISERTLYRRMRALGLAERGA